MKVGADVLRARRKEEENVERSSREGDATGRTRPRGPYSGGDMVVTAGKARRVVVR